MIKPEFSEKKRGKVGIAFWDHGQRNSQGVEFHTIDPDFYRKDIEYKLKEFKYFLKSCEMQLEASYCHPHNNSISKVDLLKCREFKHFLIKNDFWSLHLPARDIDISSYQNEGHRNYAVNETKAGVDFAFDNFVDAMAMHPGTYNMLFNSWPSPYDMAHIMRNRSQAFFRSLQDIMGHYVWKAMELEQKIEHYCSEHSENVSTLQELFRIIDADVDDDEYYSASHEIMKLIRIGQMPVNIIRYCKNPSRGLHLCLENVEPPNFLINTPEQLRRWFYVMSDLFWDNVEKHGMNYESAEKYRPYMLVDNNHFLHSQKILGEDGNRWILKYIDGAEDIYRQFVRLPGEYSDADEPLLNKFIREEEENIFYFHIGGCNRAGNVMHTHDPVKALRDNMYMVLDSRGLPVSKYSATQFDPYSELNLNEVIQVIGFDKRYILEVFDKSSEIIRSSQINTSEYLNYLYKEYCRTGNIITAQINELIEDTAKSEHHAANHQLREIKHLLKDSRFYLRTWRGDKAGRLGYDEAGFYAYINNSTEYLATVKDDSSRIWFNVTEG